MKTEIMYNHICAMLRSYDAEAVNFAAESVIANPEKWLSETEDFPFYASAAALLVDCREKLDKSTAGAGTVAALKRIIRRIETKGRVGYAGIIENDGKYYVCSGYHLLRLSADIPSLPRAKKDGQDVIKYMDGCERYSVPLALPSITEVKAFIAETKPGRGAKAANRKPYIMADGHHVNPEYLLDMMQALPNCAAFVDGKSLIRPIYFKAENGDGILLPCRPSNDYVAPEEAKTAA